MKGSGWLVRAAGVAALGGALLALSACSEKETNVTVAPSQEPPGITVSGRGEISASPDTAVFTMGIEVTRPTVAEARDEAAKLAQKLTDSVKSNKVEAKDIQTSGLSIYPRYESTRNSDQPRITGYTLSNFVTVKVRKLDTVSKVIDDAVVAGGDAARLQGISFTLEDNGKAVEDARKRAVEDAKKKAEQLAGLTGVAIDRPLSIAEVQSTPVRVYEAAAKDSAQAGAPTPVEPGSTSVVVEVSIRWAIKN